MTWLWMGSPHKNIRLMLEFVKTPSLFLHFFYINDLPDDVISNIVLSILMILLSTLRVIRYLICGKN